MSIDSTAAIVAGVLVVLAVTAGLALLWDRTRVVPRTVMGLVVVLSIAVTSALQLNRLTETYPSWAALFGTAAAPAPAAAATPDIPPPPPGKGRLVMYTVPGPVSGMTMPMRVYLPGAYFTPEGGNQHFPVIEALHGYPGTPETWIRRLDVVGALDREIAAGRMAPTIVLLPNQTPERLVDTECTNIVGGPQAETYLTVDVPAWVRSHLRVRTDRAAWGLTGYSAGAFCAMNLALKHPDLYAAAASLSGYADPGIAVGDHSEKTTNNIVWRLTHQPPAVPVALWIGWARDDLTSGKGSQRIIEAAKDPVSLVTGTVAAGGHSHTVWKSMEGPSFDWLSAHLARPV